MKKQSNKSTDASEAIDQSAQAPVMPPGGWPPDEFTGVAGRFVRDPVTGVRRPVDASEPSIPAA